ncbi:MAG: hypothetical protein HOM34_02055 [Planctomycetes bacterium]|jgi:hypothetical protein|nr:hypothetical protein [Planctomycetota bacterium]MBT4028908.1 hypothetical protein [Planctomycetota bacterium]MBT4561251.1 hypothetical protein [Planctomycetota bacterium]MBT5101628.1 hypothetical protein [Planctomycetota bacterium]MBT5119486.1 hypothetical protein [Planctomycetota bacterium]
MSRLHSLVTIGLSFGISATGLAWAWMRYLLEPVDEFALWNHPLEGEMQRFHIFIAPIFIAIVAALWPLHIRPQLKKYFTRQKGRLQKTGALLAATFPCMALSAYALQLCETEAACNFWLIAHLASSAIWVITFTTHVLLATLFKTRQAD